MLRHPAAHRFVLFVLAAVLVAAGAGCGMHSDYMREPTAPQAVAPSDDSAVVVFVRPSYRGGAVAILDEHGRFLGESVGHSHFAVKLSPGDHMLVGCAQNTAAVRASLAAGKTYYIEVAPRMGYFGNRVQLLAITPRRETWNHRDAWMDETKQLVTDETLTQDYVKDHGDEMPERLQRATQILGEYDAKELAERTIRPDDGV